MRWDDLFDDLESQLEQELSAEEVDLRAEEERLRLARLSVRDRLVCLARAGAASVRHPVLVELVDATSLAIAPTTFGRDWVAADAVGDGAAAAVIVPVSGIAALRLDDHQVGASLGAGDAEPGPGALADRLGLAFVLRDLCRRRVGIVVRARGGVFSGTIDRVGRDHLDLAVHERGQARSRTAVRELRVIPFSEVVLVRI